MPETIFYDGTCGFCHWGVRFIVIRDRVEHFRFAPLQGTTFQSEVPAAVRASLPDTMVLKTESGRLLLRSEAWIHALRRLGGGWKLLAALLRLVPRPLRDLTYDGIAAARHRVFRPAPDLCPVVPSHLRSRFDP